MPRRGRPCARFPGFRLLGTAHRPVSALAVSMLLAGYEAVAYRLFALHERLCTTLGSAADQHKLQASGGVLLGSALMKSILADTLGTAIYPAQEHEASARGAAL